MYHVLRFKSIDKYEYNLHLFVINAYRSTLSSTFYKDGFEDIDLCMLLVNLIVWVIEVEKLYSAVHLKVDILVTTSDKEEKKLIRKLLLCRYDIVQCMNNTRL